MKFLDTNLLDQLERPEFEDLRAAFNERSHPAGSIIFTPQASENLVFIIATGRARVYLAYEDKEFNLGILAKGDIYSTHSGTFIQALDDVKLLIMDLSTFRTGMAGIPEVSMTMVRVLGNILRNSFGIIDGLVFKDAGKRLAALLATEARRHGEQTEDGIVVDIDLTIEQVAKLVGATRQTVSTLLNESIRSGLLVRMARGVYRIPDPDALERLAE